jgi:putative tryptophan/tyrosine transport system substrate-binding protein
MRRRDLIALMGGTAVAWPLASRAQQPALRTIGVLLPYASSNPIMSGRYRAAFLRALDERGFAEGRDIALEFRFAEGRSESLPALAAELVRLKPAVIVTVLPPATLAAMVATKEIPIVFSSGDDPVKAGLVPNLNRPSGNATGVNPMVGALDAKRLGILHELVPRVTEIGVLFNPAGLDAAVHRSDVQAAASALGVHLHVANASSSAEIEKAFETFRTERVGALLPSTDPIYLARELAPLAARDRLPAIYSLRLDAQEGGLMSYGPNLLDSYRQLGIYTARILKGEKPGDMPVWQSVQFELVINLKTAKALGIAIPPTLLARADEVIE